MKVKILTYDGEFVNYARLDKGIFIKTGMPNIYLSHMTIEKLIKSDIRIFRNIQMPQQFFDNLALCELTEYDLIESNPNK